METLLLTHNECVRIILLSKYSNSNDENSLQIYYLGNFGTDKTVKTLFEIFNDNLQLSFFCFLPRNRYINDARNIHTCVLRNRHVTEYVVSDTPCVHNVFRKEIKFVLCNSTSTIYIIYRIIHTYFL